MIVNSGAYADGLRGQATMNGQNVYYKSDWRCHLTFIYKVEFIQITETSECIGLSTSFAGEYSLNPATLQQPTLYERGVFETELRDAEFRSLVGQDY